MLLLLLLLLLLLAPAPFTAAAAAAAVHPAFCVLLVVSVACPTLLPTRNDHRPLSCLLPPPPPTATARHPAMFKLYGPWSEPILVVVCILTSSCRMSHVSGCVYRISNSSTHQVWCYIRHLASNQHLTYFHTSNRSPICTT